MVVQIDKTSSSYIITMFIGIAVGRQMALFTNYFCCFFPIENNAICWPTAMLI